METKILEERKYDPNWEIWSEKGNLSPLGYKIVKGQSGHRLDRLSQAEYFISTQAHGTLYHHSCGGLSQFYRGLLKKELWGTFCPQCGFTYMPPRSHCWNPDCRLTKCEWKRLPHEGVVHTYTIMGFSAAPFLSMLPFILVFVRIRSANTTIAGRMKGIDPADMACDMPVVLEFIDEPRGNPMDFYFRPKEGVKTARTSKEVERLRKQLEPVREWVKKNFGG